MRIGNTGFVPTLNGYMYDQSTLPGGNPEDTPDCPAGCSATAEFCSIPDFIFSWLPGPTGGYSQIVANVYSNEMFYLNKQQMDLGRIGCATTDTASGGVLGNLEPTSLANFMARLTFGGDGSDTTATGSPFKLQESYYKCLPQGSTVFFEALGIGMGNAGLFYEVAVLMAVLILAAIPGMMNLHVEESDVDQTGVLLAEVISLAKKDETPKFDDDQKEMLASLHKAISVVLKPRLDVGSAFGSAF